MLRRTFGTGSSRTPLGSRVDLADPSSFIQHVTAHGIILFRAGATTVFALSPNSDRRPSLSAREVSPGEVARFIFEEHLVELDGELYPVVIPYFSEDYPERVGFRWNGEAGRAYRSARRAESVRLTGQLPGRRGRS